jgi:dolichyl-phosphate-mannose--protein O-mannosyl transferase
VRAKIEVQSRKKPLLLSLLLRAHCIATRVLLVTHLPPHTYSNNERSHATASSSGGEEGPWKVSIKDASSRVETKRQTTTTSAHQAVGFLY